MGELVGKVGVVTGGAGGIGTAIGRRFGQEGMKVVLADVLAEPLEATVSALRTEGIDAIGVVTDVTDFASVEKLAEETVSHFGTVDIVCNNAGTGSVSEGYIWEHDLADWRWGIDVNVLGVIHGIKAFVPLLLERGSGHVINTCSGNGGIAPIARGALGGPATAVYPMTKAAVLCLTESLHTHLEMAGGQVKAHVLFPAGFLNTGIWESWRHRPDQYAPTQERSSPATTLTAVLDRFEAAGLNVQFTPLEQVAAQVIDGLERGAFWMMGPPSSGDEVALAKARSLVERSQPDYLVDVLSKSAEGSKR
ncbi:MAG TPA: SDR family NAD(P)-dependent oxidoreductase [Acidimicrobiales bacterium]|nr:SDR family NAD(P)-dependent oxidoreductase [Acidimicrobiales bacterium]